MAKNLIIYYSHKGQNYVSGRIENLTKGNTHIVVELIQKAVGGDLFELETVKDYPAEYNKCAEQAQAELSADARPELKNYVADISEYDNIVVAGPCWWGNYPMAVFSQLEKLDFTGKKVFPVMTHEGSGQASSVQELIQYCPDAVMGPGLAVHGGSAAQSETMIVAWAKKNLE